MVSATGERRGCLTVLRDGTNSCGAASAKRADRRVPAGKSRLRLQPSPAPLVTRMWRLRAHRHGRSSRAPSRWRRAAGPAPSCPTWVAGAWLAAALASVSRRACAWRRGVRGRRADAVAPRRRAPSSRRWAGWRARDEAVLPANPVGRCEPERELDGTVRARARAGPARDRAPGRHRRAGRAGRAARRTIRSPRARADRSRAPRAALGRAALRGAAGRDRAPRAAAPRRGADARPARSSAARRRCASASERVEDPRGARRSRRRSCWATWVCSRRTCPTSSCARARSTRWRSAACRSCSSPRCCSRRWRRSSASWRDRWARAARSSRARSRARSFIAVYVPLTGAGPPVARAALSCALARAAPLVRARRAARGRRARSNAPRRPRAPRGRVVAVVAGARDRVRAAPARRRAALGAALLRRDAGARDRHRAAATHPAAAEAGSRRRAGPAAFAVTCGRSGARAEASVAGALAASIAAVLATLPFVWARLGEWSPSASWRRSRSRRRRSCCSSRAGSRRSHRASCPTRCWSSRRARSCSRRCARSTCCRARPSRCRRGPFVLLAAAVILAFAALTLRSDARAETLRASRGVSRARSCSCPGRRRRASSRCTRSTSAPARARSCARRASARGSSTPARATAPRSRARRWVPLLRALRRRHDRRRREPRRQRPRRGDPLAGRAAPRGSLRRCAPRTGGRAVAAQRPASGRGRAGGRRCPLCKARVTARPGSSAALDAPGNEGSRTLRLVWGADEVVLTGDAEAEGLRAWLDLRRRRQAPEAPPRPPPRLRGRAAGPAARRDPAGRGLGQRAGAAADRGRAGPAWDPLASTGRDGPLRIALPAVRSGIGRAARRGRARIPDPTRLEPGPPNVPMNPIQSLLPGLLLLVTASFQEPAAAPPKAERWILHLEDGRVRRALARETRRRFRSAQRQGVGERARGDGRARRARARGAARAGASARSRGRDARPPRTGARRDRALGASRRVCSRRRSPRSTRCCGRTRSARGARVRRARAARADAAGRRRPLAPETRLVLFGARAKPALRELAALRLAAAPREAALAAIARGLASPTPSVRAFAAFASRRIDPAVAAGRARATRRRRPVRARAHGVRARAARRQGRHARAARRGRARARPIRACARRPPRRWARWARRWRCRRWQRAWRCCRAAATRAARARTSTSANQVTYVKDFNPEIAQGASIADPIVDIVEEGTVLDVRVGGTSIVSVRARAPQPEPRDSRRSRASTCRTIRRAGSRGGTSARRRKPRLRRRLRR